MVVVVAISVLLMAEIIKGLSMSLQENSLNDFQGVKIKTLKILKRLYREVWQKSKTATWERTANSLPPP
jgi:hypothetical protein